jgi:uncharacterized membrane protein SpoIIM required for sporulation
MAASILKMFQYINPQIFLFSALLFFIGYAIAPTAYYKKIRWLTIYPFFIIHLMDKYFKKEWPPVWIFLVILILNTFSLFVNLLSGWGIILPVLFSIYMGINIGVVMYHTLEGQFYYTSLLNPVAMLELPASWISITMAIQFSLEKYFDAAIIEQATFGDYVKVFIFIIIPMLIIADLIETSLIVISRKREGGQD